MTWEFELIAGPFGGVTEGPAWDGKGLLYTHIPASRIMRYMPETGESMIHMEGTNNANGLMLDECGKLYACEGGERRVVRYSGTGTPTILADNFDGQRLNIPNDLAIDPQGSVWFTDPYYEGAGGTWSLDRANKDLDHDSVYKTVENISGEWEIQRMTFDTTRPNGILFSLKYETLYVAQSGRGPDEKRQLRAYPILSNGTLGNARILHDFGLNRGIDGMCLTMEGDIVATAGWDSGGPGSMLYVFSPTGKVIEMHPFPVDRPTNCSFGGDDLNILYVTSIDGHLYKTDTDLKGRLLYPPNPMP